MDLIDAPLPSAFPAGVTENSRGLCFSSLIARERVHRHSVAEVFLTDCVRTGETSALCAAQWSQGHRMFRPHGNTHDTLLVAETLRQVGICVADSVLGLPLDWVLVMDRLTMEAFPDGMATGRGPAEIVLEVTVEETVRRTSMAAGFRVSVTYRCGDVRMAKASGWTRCVSPRIYRRLRGEVTSAAPVRVAPVPAAKVGMGLADDVAVGRERRGAWPLRVLPEHPILFDHPLDHVPGMLVMEAFRQVARLDTGWPTAWARSIDLRTTSFVELGRPAVVEIDDTTRLGEREQALALALVQDGRRAAEASVFLVDGR